MPKHVILPDSPVGRFLKDDGTWDEAGSTGPHTHPISEVTGLSAALAGKEPADAAIQWHIASAHAPSDAQKNSDITKGEIEAKLTGQITSHTHPGGAGGPATCKQTAAQTSINATLVPLLGQSFDLVAGTLYHFAFYQTFRSGLATVGIKLGLTFPAVTRFSCLGRAPIAAAGVGCELQGFITASGGFVLSTAVPAINTDYLAILEGVIKPSANGTLQLTFSAETTGTTVTAQPESCGVLTTIP